MFEAARQLQEYTLVLDEASAMKAGGSYGNATRRRPSPFDAHAEEGDEQRGLIRADDETVDRVGCAAHAIQEAVAEVGTGEPSVGDVGAAEIAAAKDHASKIGAVEVGFSEIAPLKDALLQACHPEEREVEFALPKQKAFRLHFAACCAGEPGGEHLYALE